MGMGGSHTDVGGVVDRKYGGENRNQRVEFAPTIVSSMRALRREQLGYISDSVDAETAVRVGKVNRFRD